MSSAVRSISTRASDRDFARRHPEPRRRRRISRVEFLPLRFAQRQDDAAASFFRRSQLFFRSFHNTQRTFSSVQIFFSTCEKKVHTPIAFAKTWTYIALTFAPDAPWQMLTARRQASKRDGLRSGYDANAPLQMSTRRRCNEKQGFSRQSRFGCPLVDVNGPRTGSRDQRSRAFFFSGRMRA